ncbi:uncharacterized protein LOC111373528 [Olea europaea var. sylvestris]|uniref:uncharacterized protein LOC111373528 n=1 Tax=Olea europaea var. sylvestris TaxID=158386 RepID=UPI000C1D3FBE|nr:uncharacterized protein LOC111373528 [Olea europaea var. sylvestris]
MTVESGPTWSHILLLSLRRFSRGNRRYSKLRFWRKSAKSRIAVVDTVRRFEEVRMKDDETFDEFYAKLNDIVNSSFNLALKSIKEDESSDTESLRDEEIAYFVKKFQKVLKNRRKPQDKKSGAPNRFTKVKTKTFNNKGSSDKPRLVRCHECQRIGHYRNEYPSYKKNQRKGKCRALVVSLTNNESETSDRQESSSSEDEGNYMAFVSTVKSESDKESDKVEVELPNDNSSNEEEDDIDIQENSLKSGSELKCVNEKLEDKIKTLTSELVKSNAHLQTFVSGTKKLDNILEMNNPAGDRKGLGYVEGNTHVAGPSKTVFVSASKKVNAVNSSNKGKNVPREQSHQSRRNFIPRYPQPRTFEPRFIPTCHHCGALGHTRPRCYRLGNERKNLNIPSQVSFLSNQVSHLTEMLTKITRSTLSSKKVWVKKGDLARHSGQEKCFVAHVALKAQNYDMWYLDSACSRRMCGNKALFTTLDECTVQIHGLPVISNVLYVEGVRTTDSCYGVLPNSNYVCRSAKIDIGPSENVVCGPCQLDKQLKGSHKKTSKILTKRPLELIHMDLMGPSRTESLGSKRYILVVVDDFSRFTWIELLREKSDACDLIKSLCKRLSNQLNLKVSRMRSDHGREFENFNLESFCMDEGILVYLKPKTDQTPYEILKGKKPTVKYFRVFGSKCYILCDRENLSKFESKSDEGIFLGYSRNSRAFRVYNLRTHVVMDSSDPTEPPVSESSLGKLETPENKTFPQDRDKDPKEPSTRVKSNHPKDNIIGDLDEGMRLRRRVLNNIAYTSYVSQVEPKKVEEALSDECWVNAMHEELNQFARNNVWILVPRPENCNIYVDDIIFGSPLESLAYEFAECLKQEFEMSMVEELSYFLGLQVRQREDRLFISQSKYAKDLVKRFGLDSKKHTRTPMSTSLK